MRNELLREAINRLNAKPEDATRIDFYRQLTAGFLLVVVAHLPSGIGVGETVLEGDTNISVLTTSLPGGGDAIVAFTDEESLEARASGALNVAMRSLDVLRLVIDGGYDGVIINPAGPWAGVPREDVLRILDGVWSATDT